MYPDSKELFIESRQWDDHRWHKGFSYSSHQIWEQKKSLTKKICSSSLRDTSLKKLESFLVFAASSPCLPQIGLGVINIEFDNIKFFFSFTRSFYVTLKRSFPDQGKFFTSLKAIWESIEKPFLALFYFLRYCRKMDSSFLRYNTVCHNTLCISL